MSGKIKKIVIIVVAIIVVLSVAFIVYGKTRNNKEWQNATAASEIVINESDSKDIKIKKIEKKIELLNSEIQEYNNQIEPEVEELNKLYEEYKNKTEKYVTESQEAESQEIESQEAESQETE
ncbi:MAG: hypothetical protein IKF17_03335 [Clostridia bacterium]|nr:hypothetical protein [Clostridia bacterium]